MKRFNCFPINKILEFLKTKQIAILLESSKQDSDNNYSYIFSDPVGIIQTSSVEKISDCFKKIENANKHGMYTCGYMSYEAGYAISEKLASSKPKQLTVPLIWMGVFKKPLIFNHRTNSFLDRSKNRFFNNFSTPQPKNNYSISNLKFQINKSQYVSKINTIKKLIEKGDTYQVNFTSKFNFKLNGSELDLYKKIRKNQPVNYGALIKTDDFQILSFSPELFFKKDKDKILVKPMKGTLCRGFNRQEDKKNKSYLKKDIKNQAENLMIVDLLRNDLGKISKTGSVKVEKLFEVETYKTLLQMTSSISSTLKPDTRLHDLFLSLFPSGSVTGAPKLRTMQIIEQLEPEPRGVYTGAIGFWGPDKDAIFNVAIRTVQIKNQSAEMGIGSGITYSSDPAAEYDECKLKADFLKIPEFKLIETMLLKKDHGIDLLDLHLKRLKESALFFGYYFSKKDIIKGINKFIDTLDKTKDQKIRLLFDKDSNIQFEAALIETIRPKQISKVTISSKQTKKNNIFLYHKNTNRQLYQQEYKKYKQLGFFDVIFKNRDGQITEGAISNIFIKKGNKLYTPKIECGLLPGVYRTYMMQNKKNPPIEKILYPDDLKKADAIYCSNAVRGLTQVKLI